MESLDWNVSRSYRIIFGFILLHCFYSIERSIHRIIFKGLEVSLNSYYRKGSAISYFMIKFFSYKIVLRGCHYERGYFSGGSS